VTQAKLEEVFRIAGNVIEVELKVDKDGRSRGMGTVRFEHPMEAVQCIGILESWRKFLALLKLESVLHHTIIL
jgi:hypothetical protein